MLNKTIVALGITILCMIAAFRHGNVRHFETPTASDRVMAMAIDELSKLEEDRTYAKARLNTNLEELVREALGEVEKGEAVCRRIIAEGDLYGGPDIVKAAVARTECMLKLRKEEPTLVRYDAGMTLRGYAALKPGMKKTDADQILRCDGVERSRSGLMATYAWQEGLVCIVVTFENDKLLSKAQTGLE